MTTRESIVDYCNWGIRNAAQIHYTQGPARDDFLIAGTRHLPLWTDCSGFATAAYKDAGAPDPNGLAYKWIGWTGTMLKNGRQVTEPLPGDLILFGSYPGHHVTIYLETWRGAWITCSHGGEYGPIRVLNHVEELAQGVPYQVRRYLPA